jgi:hypothetical protein
MRPRRSLISAVLTAALLLGQWLAAAHEPDHALQPGAAHACAVCVYAHGAGSGAMQAVPNLVLDGAVEAPDTPATASPLAALLRHHPIRGPPVLLA